MDPAQVLNGFAVRLLDACWQEHPGENLLLSPAANALMLLLLRRAAHGETRAGIDVALGADGGDGGAEALGRCLGTPARSAQVDFAVASSLWLAPGVECAADTVNAIRRLHDADIRELTNDVEPVNAWVCERTRGCIERIAEPGDVDVGAADHPTLFAALNAVYFKGPWQERFDAHDTRPDTFYLDAERRIDHPLMRSREHFRYLEGRFGGVAWQAVRLPYRSDDEGDFVVADTWDPGAEPAPGTAPLERHANDAFAMEVWLPEAGLDPGAAIRALPLGMPFAALEFGRDHDAFEATVVLPRFSLEGTYELRDALSSMGMAFAFDADRGDFRGLVPRPPEGLPICLSAHRHKARVEVDEEGTVAAAAVFDPGMLGSGTPMEAAVEVRCDRPFAFVIRHLASGVAWFAGYVVDPSGGNAPRRAVGNATVDAFYRAVPGTGETLRDVIEENRLRARDGAVDVDAALALVRATGEQLALLHDLGAVHGGLSPRQVAVLDRKPARVRLRKPHAAGGHPGYSDPDLDPRSGEGRAASVADDVFGLACIAYTLLAGRHAFRTSVASARAQGVRPPPLDALTPDQNRTLLAALSFDAAASPRSIEALLAGLEPRRGSWWRRLLGV